MRDRDMTLKYILTSGKTETRPDSQIIFRPTYNYFQLKTRPRMKPSMVQNITQDRDGAETLSNQWSE